jgi:hypothetical protein
VEWVDDGGAIAVGGFLVSSLSLESVKCNIPL